MFIVEQGECNKPCTQHEAVLGLVSSVHERIMHSHSTIANIPKDVSRWAHLRIPE